MHTLVNRTARELARDYFNDQLSFDDYRDKRRRLIDQATGFDVDDETDAPPAPVADITASEPGVPAQAVVADGVPGTRHLPLPIILLLVAGGLGVAGWMLFSGDDRAPSVPPVGMTQAPVPALQETVENSQAGKLINDFVEADDWSNSALADFVLVWSVLEIADQDRVRSTAAFSSLTEGLREQILEQRALEDFSGVDEREEVLISFVEHLGVSKSFADLEQAAIDSGDDSGSGRESVDTPGAAVSEVRISVPPPPVVTESVRLPVSDSGVSVTSETPHEKAQSPAVEAPVQAARPVDDPCPASLITTRRRVCRDTLPNGVPGPILVVLPPGSFQMGSIRESNEQPVHHVEIDRPFAVSVYEISRQDYRRFCRTSGVNCPTGYWDGTSNPMTNISWSEARAYVQWLSQVTGAVYRLPTEAEWEYAARAGTTADYPFGTGDKILPSDARFDADSPLPVNDKSVNTNPFRLRHILGNVREWVADVWLEDYQSAPVDGSARTQPDNGRRVVRGGSYADSAVWLRPAARIGLPAGTRDRETGFRIVREIHN